MRDFRHLLSPRRLAENWRLKLAALALAVLLWAVVSAEQVTTQWIPVRVEPQLRDPAYVLVGLPEPAEVEVRFTGPGRELWELALDRPSIVLPLREVGPQRAFALDPNNVRWPEVLRGVSATDIRPAVVRLDLQRVVTRELPVRVRVGSRSLQRYVLGDSVRVLPSTVRVTGAADAVARLASVSTRVFDVVPDDSTFSRRIALDTAGLEGISLSAREVVVSGEVDRRAERVLPGVPVALPPGLQATPAAVEVRLEGAERALRAVFAEGVRVRVDMGSLPAPVPLAGVEVPVRVEGIPAEAAARTVPLRVRVSPAAPPPPETVPPRSPRR